MNLPNKHVVSGTVEPLKETTSKSGLNCQVVSHEGQNKHDLKRPCQQNQSIHLHLARLFQSQQWGFTV